MTDFSLLFITLKFTENECALDLILRVFTRSNSPNWSRIRFRHCDKFAPSSLLMKLAWVLVDKKGVNKAAKVIRRIFFEMFFIMDSKSLKYCFAQF